MGKFEIFTDSSDQFRFNLKAANGEVILTSQGYTTKEACHNGINSVKENAKNDDRYSRLTSENDKSYFNLTSNNNKVIGTSQMYFDTSAMEKGIDSVKNNASTATIEDNS